MELSTQSLIYFGIACLFPFLIFGLPLWDRILTQIQGSPPEKPSPYLQHMLRENSLKPSKKYSGNTVPIWGIQALNLVILPNGQTKVYSSGTLSRQSWLENHLVKIGASIYPLTKKSFESWPAGVSCSVSWEVLLDGTRIAYPVTIIGSSRLRTLHREEVLIARFLSEARESFPPSTTTSMKSDTRPLSGN